MASCLSLRSPFASVGAALTVKCSCGVSRNDSFISRVSEGLSSMRRRVVCLFGAIVVPVSLGALHYITGQLFNINRCEEELFARHVKQGARAEVAELPD